MSNRTIEDGNSVNVQQLLNRKLFIDALLSGKHKQAFGIVGDVRRPLAPVCAYGLLMRLFYKGTVYSNNDVPTDFYPERIIGVSPGIISDMIGKNDAGYSFKQLAYWLADEALPAMKRIEHLTTSSSR